VALVRILHRELMEAELAPDGIELVLRRLEEPDPGEAAVDAAGLIRLIQIELARPADALLVDGHVDDHSGEL
jgi:hypothetical protein